jgi:catechol 2,3-dioxygenase-like lactoylglutathione lyase family enzyme
MITPLALSVAHMECRSFDDSLPVLTDILGFKEVGREGDAVTLKNPNTDWLLVVHEGGDGHPDRPIHHHFGVRVEKKAEVDSAWDYITTHQEEYGLQHLIPQVNRHGSYSIHFQEPGTNYWEIECYEDVVSHNVGLDRLGGVRDRHWTTPLPAGSLPGRGWVPQAFTHGTLGCADAETYGRFAEEVLGFEVHRAYATTRYLKHPAKQHYIVCLQVEQPNNYSPNFRFTLELASPEAVEQAHARMAAAPRELGLAEVRPVAADGQRASFLVRDTDGNWWEYTG